jgi:hypothetical protein
VPLVGERERGVHSAAVPTSLCSGVVLVANYPFELSARECCVCVCARARARVCVCVCVCACDVRACAQRVR